MVSEIIRPDVYVTERNEAVLISGSRVINVASVFQADRGPIYPKYIFSPDEYKEKFGYSNSIDQAAHDCNLDFLNYSNNNSLICYRITKNASYSSGTVLKVKNQSKYITYSVGTKNYSAERISVLAEVGTFILGDIVDITLNSSIISIEFDGTVIATEADMRLAVKTAIINTLNGSEYTTAFITDYGTDMLITAPLDVTVDFSQFNITHLDTTETSVNVNETVVMFHILSENPGKWSKSNIGFKITNMNSGFPQKQTTLFSAVPTAGFSVVVTVNEETLTAIDYATSATATMASIAAAIKANLDSRYPGTSIVSVKSDNRTIEITANNSKFDIDVQFVATGWTFTTTKTTRLESDDTFTLEVYERPNIYTPIEAYKVCLAEKIDGYGNQLNIRHVVNEKYRSSRIQIVQPESSKSEFLYNGFSDIQWLNGGTDGDTVTNADYISAWSVFKNTNQFSLDIAFSAGYRGADVCRGINDTVEAASGFAFLDAPPITDPQELVSFRRFDLNINSERCALECIQYNMTDSVTGLTRYAYRSGRVAADMVATIKALGYSYSPRTLERSAITNANGLAKYLMNDEQDLLSSNQINYPIRLGTSYIEFEDRTLTTQDSPLSFYPHRIHLNYIRKGSMNMLYGMLKQPHEELTWTRFGASLQRWLDGQHLHRVEVVVDSRNNTNEAIQDAIATVSIIIEFIPNIRAIKLDLVVGKYGTTVTETVL